MSDILLDKVTDNSDHNFCLVANDLEKCGNDNSTSACANRVEFHEKFYTYVSIYENLILQKLERKFTV